MRWVGCLCVLALACSSNEPIATPTPPPPGEADASLGTMSIAMPVSQATVVVGESTTVSFDLGAAPADVHVSVDGLPPSVTDDVSLTPSPPGTRTFTLHAASDAPLTSLIVKLTARAPGFVDASVNFRLNVSSLDGSLDPTFGVGGYLLVPIAGLEPVGIASAGSKMIVAGAISGNTPLVARLNDDGTIDTSFGQAGIAPSSVASSASALAVAPDGTIALSTSAGILTFDSSGAAGTSIATPLVAPLVFSGATLVGAVQSGVYAFTSSSSAFTSLPSTLLTRALAPEDDGSILVVNATETRRVVPNGTGGYAVDASFDVLAGGYAAAIGAASTTMVAGDTTLTRIALDGTTATTSLDPRVGAAAIILGTPQRDGFIVVGGGAIMKTPNAWIAMARYDAAGIQVLEFGTLGIATTQQSTYSSLLHAGAAFDAQGRLWVLAQSQNPKGAMIMRYRIAP